MGLLKFLKLGLLGAWSCLGSPLRCATKGVPRITNFSLLLRLGKHHVWESSTANLAQTNPHTVGTLAYVSLRKFVQRQNPPPFISSLVRRAYRHKHQGANISKAKSFNNVPLDSQVDSSQFANPAKQDPQDPQDPRFCVESLSFTNHEVGCSGHFDCSGGSLKQHKDMFCFAKILLFFDTIK